MLTLVVGIGFVGAHILEQISDKPVLGLSRSRNLSSTPDGDRICVHDLDQNSRLAVELPRTYTIIYTIPPAGDAAEDTRLKHMFDQLPHSPERMVYISTTGVYGHHDGALIDENAETRPSSARSEQRLAAEQYLQEKCYERNIKLVILRVPGIYGPDRLGIESIHNDVPVLIESDCYPGNRIHVADLTNCCIKATSNEVPAGIYNVGDGDYRSATWFAHEVARQSALQPRPEINRASAKQEFSAMRMSFLSDSRRIDTRKMNTVLGVTSIFANTEDGIKSSLEN